MQHNRVIEMSKKIETVKIEVEINKPLHDAIAEYLKAHPIYPNGVSEFVADAALQKIERVHPHF